MSDEAAFLRVIAESPDDDAPRLVFADWLADRDDPRAAWVRDAELREWMGPHASDPLPRLVETLGDRTDWPRMWRARAVLLKLGERASRAVCDWLRDDPERWPERRMTESLIPALPEPPPSVDELLAELYGDDWEAAEMASWHLRSHGPDPRVLQSLLATVAAGRVPECTMNLVYSCLGQFGPAADPAVPHLASAMFYCGQACAALERIRPDPWIVFEHINTDNDDNALEGVHLVAGLSLRPTETLLHILQTTFGRRSRVAAKSLGRRGRFGGLGNTVADAVAGLIAVFQRPLDRDDDILWIYTATALGEIGEASAIPALRAALALCNGDNPFSRQGCGDVRTAITEAIEILS